MRYRIYILLMAMITMAVIACVIGEAGTLWIAGLCVASLITTALLARAVHTPLKAAQNGMYLLREQDFASRLRPTGQADADRIVELYNTLIDSMRAERLKNLEQDRFLSQVVDVSPLGIAICDFDGRIVQTNRAWDRMQSPQLALAIDGVADGDTATVRVADSLIVRISRLWFMDKGFRRRFILVEKLTEEIAAAQKQMFNTIVRTIGHEVNNSLGSVMSVLESLGEMHAGDALAADAITSCSTSCANLVGFVRGYADIVKLPAPVMEQVDLKEWLTRLRPTLQALGADHGITLTLILGAGETHSCFDPMLMERVMVNLVKNAVESIAARKNEAPEKSASADMPDVADASDRQGAIIVKVDTVSEPEAPTCHLLSVTDNGKGISPEVSRKLFTPFFSTKNPDRGLGLMLVTDILRAHRSRFSLSTSAETSLTTFSFTLP